MRLPSFKRLYKNDYPQEFQALIEQLSVSLNIGIESLYEALNNKLSLTDNAQATVKTFNVILDSNGVPKNTTSFRVNTPGPVLGLTVLRAVNINSEGTFPTGAPFISYRQVDQNITISHITGLPSNNQYQLTVVAWGA